MKILVTDGDTRAALAVIRSLGKDGHDVYVAGPSVTCIAFKSCFCSKGFVVPDPLQNGVEYTDAISNLAVDAAIDVIYPMTEQAIYLLNTVRDTFPAKTLLACPSQEMMHAVSDKSKLFKMAERLHVTIPKTLHLAGIDELSSVVQNIDKYPVVVKPSRSRILSKNGFLSGSVRYAASQQELEQLYSSSPELQYPSLIQEKIVGPGTGLFTLYAKSKHLALFSHKRLREKPPSGGVSVVSESIPLDEEMVTAADALLSEVGFSGVAMVEFKRDQRDGKAKLMEINGRFWGSLQLAIVCGVDFPKLYLDYLQGALDTPQDSEYLIGHRLKWFFGTMDHLLIRLKNRGKDFNLPAGFPGRLHALFDFLKVMERNTSFDVFDWSDLGPFRAETSLYLQQIMKRGR